MLVQNIEALKQKMALSQTGEKKKDEVPPLNSQTVPEDEKFDYHSPNHSENSMIETSSGIYTEIIGNLYSSQDFKVMNHIPNQPNLNSPNEKLEIPQLPPPTFQQYESHLPPPNFQQYESQQPNQPNQPQQYLETNLIHSQQITTQASAPLMQSQPVTNGTLTSNNLETPFIISFMFVQDNETPTNDFAKIKKKRSFSNIYLTIKTE